MNAAIEQTAGNLLEEAVRTQPKNDSTDMNEFFGMKFWDFVPVWQKEWRWAARLQGETAESKQEERNNNDKKKCMGQNE